MEATREAEIGGEAGTTSVADIGTPAEGVRDATVAADVSASSSAAAGAADEGESKDEGSPEASSAAAAPAADEDENEDDEEEEEYYDEEEEEEGEIRDTKESDATADLRSRLYKFCKELDVDGIREVLASEDAPDVNVAVATDSSGWYHSEIYALPVVLGHLPKKVEGSEDDKNIQIVEATQLLLKARADPNVKGKDASMFSHCVTPLTLCACGGTSAAQITRMLLEAGADLELGDMTKKRNHYQRAAAESYLEKSDEEGMNVVLEFAQKVVDPLPRDLLHLAARRGCTAAKRSLADLGIPRFAKSKDEPKDVDSAADLTFPLPWRAAAKEPVLKLVHAKASAYPCEMLLFDVPRDLKAEPPADGAFSEILRVAPGLGESLAAQRDRDYYQTKVRRLVAVGELKSIFLAWICLDMAAAYRRPTDNGDGSPERIRGEPHGSGSPHNAVEALVLQSFLQTFALAQHSHCQHLAIAAPRTILTPEETACVFVNAVLLYDRHAREDRQRPSKLAMIVPDAQEFEAYKHAFSRLTAANVRRKFFEELPLDKFEAALAAPCPQPHRNASVKPSGDLQLRSDAPPATRLRELKLPAHAVGFVADSLLTVEECQSIVKLAEQAGLEDVAWEYDRNYRDCLRSVSHDKVTADVLWKRLGALFKREDLHDVRPIGWGTEGVWAPCGVNECLRVSRYDKGGHFAMHRDGPFVINDDTRSIFTVLIYLNNEFEGGATVLEGTDGEMDEAFEHEDDKRPRVGSAVVFTHNARHQGKEVSAGSKYILRTDVMFKRVDDLGLGQHGPRYLEDAKFQRCEALYRESIELQNEGDPKGSTQKYLEALEMQSELASIRREKERVNGALPDAGWHLALSGLNVHEAVSSAAVSRRMKRLAFDSNIWRQRYAHRWLTHATQMNPLAPWYTLYKYRCAADECWKVACFDIGFRATRFAMLGSKPSQKPQMLSTLRFDEDSWSYMPPLRKPGDVGPASMGVIPSAIAQVRGHYWGAASGFKSYFVGHDAIRRPWFGGQDPVGAFKTGADRPPNLQAFFEFVRWAIAFGFEETCWPSGHPVLISIPPHLQHESHSEFIENIMKCCQTEPQDSRRMEGLSVPYLLLEDHAVLALLSVGSRNGLNVHLAEVCSVTAVLDGAVVPGCQRHVPMREGLGLDEGFLSARWVAAQDRDHGLAWEKFDSATVGLVLQEVIKTVVRTAQEVIESAPRLNTLARGVAKEFTIVVTTDGNLEAAGCDFLELASAIRSEFRDSPVASSWPRLSIADVHPEKAVIIGSLATASSPEGRKKFRSAEGSCPPPFQRPSLHRW